MEVQSPIITIYRGETAKELNVITGAFDKEKVNYYKRINPSGHPSSRYRIWDNREYFPFEIKILQKDETYVRQIIANLKCTKQLIRPQPSKSVWYAYFWIVILFIFEILFILFSS